MNFDSRNGQVPSGATYWPSLKRSLPQVNDPDQSIKRFKPVDYAPKMNLVLPPTLEADIRCQHKIGMDSLAINGTENYSQNGSTSGRSTPSLDNAPGKLFVGGLSWQTTPEKLREYFGQFGSVTDVLVMKDPVTQRSRGFGFITFSTPDAVERVLAVPTHTLDGKKIDPKHATPKSKSKANKTKKIFVGGVSQETSAEEVKAYFSQFGKVDEAVMLMDQQTKRHRGFGFVTFENEDVVDSVCEIHFHTIKNKKVECKKAQPKEAVQAANTAALLGKRVILNNLGIPTATTTLGMQGLADMPGMASIQQNQSFVTLAAAQNQAAAAAAAAALGGYGKIMQVNGTGPHMGGGGLPLLTSYRYAPYPMPSALTSNQAAQHAHVAALMAQHQYQQQQQDQHQQSQHQQQQQHQQQHQNQQQVSGALPHSIASTLSLATNQAIPTMAQAAHLSAVLPTVSISGSGSLASPSVAAPANNLAVAAAAAAAAKYAAAVSGPNGLTPNPYQGFNLANVDMSSFQGIDWSSMYGTRMYV